MGGLTITRSSITLVLLTLLLSIAAFVLSILYATTCDDFVSGMTYSPLFVVFVNVAIICPVYCSYALLMRKLRAAEGALETRLLDGSVRLLRVAWLLDQPSDYVLPCRQDLPDAAFWPPDDAVH